MYSITVIKLHYIFITTPNCTDAYFHRGCVRHEKGDKRGAIADYNQVIKIEPDNAYAYVKRGSIRREKAKREEAVADFQKAISLFRKESMMDEVRNLQKEVRNLQKEIKNTPWWQTRLF